MPHLKKVVIGFRPCRHGTGTLPAMSLPQKKPLLSGAQRHLIEAILKQVFDWQDWLGKPALDPRVMAAIAATPREAFVPRHLEEMACLDEALDIEDGQRKIGRATV